MRYKSKSIRSLRLENLESRCVFSAGPLGGQGFLGDLWQPAVTVLINSSSLDQGSVELLVFVRRLSLETVDRGTRPDVDLGLRGEGEGEPAEFTHPLGRPSNEIVRGRDRSPVSNLIPQADIGSPGTTTVFVAPPTVQVVLRPTASSGTLNHLPQPSTVPSIPDFTANLANPSAGKLPERERGLSPSSGANTIIPPGSPAQMLDLAAFSTRSSAALPTLSDSRAIDFRKPTSESGFTNFSNSRSSLTRSLTFSESSSDERRASLESQLSQLYDQYQTPSSAALDEVIDNLAREHQRGQSTEFQRNGHSNTWTAPRAQTSPAQPLCGRDGGLISLAINRGLSLDNVDQIADVADHERHAWSTNLGVYRGLEVAGFALTQSAPILNNQPTFKQASDQDESNEVATRRPILASVAVLAGIYSLRRARKSRLFQIAKSTETPQNP